jgi:hypothetical protein
VLGYVVKCCIWTCVYNIVGFNNADKVGEFTWLKLHRNNDVNFIEYFTKEHQSSKPTDR